MRDVNGRHISTISAVVSALVCACSALLNSDFERASPDGGGFDGSAGSAGAPGGTGGSGAWPSFAGSGGMGSSGMDGGGGTGAGSGGSGASAGMDGGATDEDDSGVAGGTGGTGGSGAATSLDDGLVAYYPFSGNANDWSGNGNDGTVYGAVLTEDRFGNPDSAYLFDGEDDFIDLGNGTSLKTELPATMAAWMRFDVTQTDSLHPHFFFGNNFVDNRYYGLLLMGSDKEMGASICNGGTPSPDGRITRGAELTRSLGVWYHQAAVFKAADDIAIYIDGEPVEGAAYSGNGGDLLYNDGPGVIGKWDSNSYGPPDFFAGAADEVRLYNRALTASEVSALYELGEADCVAEHYQRCGADGDVYRYDSCGNAGGLVVACPEQHATCVNLADNTAECRCLNHWEGDDCNTCPSPWDAFEGCWGFFDDFESGLGNWLVSGQDWALDDGTARSGDHCLSDSPGAVPLANTDASAIMVDSVDLSKSVDPVLRFWGKALLGDSGDHIRVYASADSGLTWDSLWDTAYSSIAHWFPLQIDLNAYVGSNIKIRFQFTTDGDSYLGDGWWIDDVWVGERDTELLPYPFFDDFESGLDNWLLSGKDWALTDADFRSASHSLTDSPAGNYIAEAYPFAALAHPVDLSTSTAPVLTFWYRGSLGDSGDELLVYASQDAGTNWTEIWSRAGGTVSTWTLVQVDLSSYAGAPLALAFTLWADGDDNLADGWYIDDVGIGEL